MKSLALGSAIRHLYTKTTAMNYKQGDGGDGSCLECGRAIYGRPDKKFCDDSCRNRYHSRKRSLATSIRNKVIGTLIKNHSILEQMIRSGITSASLQELEAMGFRSTCITGHMRGRHRHEEYSCFDIIYYQSNSRVYNVRYTDFLGRP